MEPPAEACRPASRGAVFAGSSRIRPGLAPGGSGPSGCGGVAPGPFGHAPLAPGGPGGPFSLLWGPLGPKLGPGPPWGPGALLGPLRAAVAARLRRRRLCIAECSVISARRRKRAGKSDCMCNTHCQISINGKKMNYKSHRRSSQRRPSRRGNRAGPQGGPRGCRGPFLGPRGPRRAPRGPRRVPGV